MSTVPEVGEVGAEAREVDVHPAESKKAAVQVLADPLPPKASLVRALSAEYEEDCTPPVPHAPHAPRSSLAARIRVYRRRSDNARVAVKMYYPQHLPGGDWIDGILREVVLHSSAVHANVVMLADVIVEPRRICLVFDLMACSLSDWLAGPGAPPVPTSEGGAAGDDAMAAVVQARERSVRCLLLAVATALAHIQQAGIVHGALTSDNILLARAGELATAKVGNFSSARRWSKGDDARARSEESLFASCRDAIRRLYADKSVPHGSPAGGKPPPHAGHRRSATSDQLLLQQPWDASRREVAQAALQYVAPERHAASGGGGPGAASAGAVAPAFPPTASLPHTRAVSGAVMDASALAVGTVGAIKAAATPCPVPALAPCEDSAPELLCAGDIWSLGVVAYVALSGLLPFEAPDAASVWQNMHEGRLRFDGPVWAHVSPAACQLISRMLALDPRRRCTVAQVLASPWLAAAAEDAVEGGEGGAAGDGRREGTLVRARSDVLSGAAGQALDARRVLERDKRGTCRPHAWEHTLAASRLATRPQPEPPAHMRRAASDYAASGLARKPPDGASHAEELRKLAMLRGAVRTGKQVVAAGMEQAAS